MVERSRDIRSKCDQRAMAGVSSGEIQVVPGDRTLAALASAQRKMGELRGARSSHEGSATASATCGVDFKPKVKGCWCVGLCQSDAFGSAVFFVCSD